MAELPYIGKQCSKCQQLDFLPIVCHFCKNVYCKDHGTAITHQCLPEIEHQKILDSTNPKKSTTDFKPCTECCKMIPILETVQCLYCVKLFCLVHRHHSDHQCTEAGNRQAQVEAQQAESKAIVDSVLAKLKTTLGSGITVKNKGPKNDALALRVATMKLKSIATGPKSVPLEERLFFYVTYVSNKLSFSQDFKTITEKPVYVSREWSVGKFVDWVAEEYDLVNRNNNPSEPKLVITSEAILAASNPANNVTADSVNFCCDQKNSYFCFRHKFKELESSQTIRNTDKLLITYLQL